MTCPLTIRIQEADFDIASEIALLTQGRTDIGAVVSFSGICRGSEGGGRIAALRLEHYPGMAEAEIRRHAEEALARWPLDGGSIVSSALPTRSRTQAKYLTFILHPP